MKNTFKAISLLLVILTVASCFVGCGIQNAGLSSGALENNATADLATNGVYTENSATESYKNTISSNAKEEKLIVTATPEGGKEVMVKSNSALTPITLSENSTTNYTIVSHYSTSLAGITSFLSGLKAKTGVDFPITTRSKVETVGGKQIVIASFDGMVSYKYQGAPKFKSWTGGAVTVVGETIYIGVPEPALLESVLASFVSKIKAVGSNKYVIASDLKYAYDKCAVSEYIPAFRHSGATDKGMYSAGGGNYQRTYTGVKATEVSNYCKTLMSNGFTLQQQNTINGNSFYLFVKGDTLVHVNWFSKLNRFSIVYGPKTYVPASKPVTGYTKRATPTISMLALGEIGTSIVIQLEDASFLLIDGGLGNNNFTKDSEILWNFLSSKAPAGEKPRITWLVTHIHTDHRALFQKFIPKYKDKIELELVIWNLPDFNEIHNKYASGWKEGGSTIKPAENYATPVATLTDVINKNFPNTPIYTCHTGEKIYLPGCEIEILVCHEDYYLNGFVWVNDTSLTCRITMQGKTMMVFGDTTQAVSNAIITPAYGNYIKSDILQVAHHGNRGGTLATFKDVDPDICLWSASKTNYTAYKAEEPNNWLHETSGTDGQRARTHYHQSNTTTITIPTMSAKQTTVY